MGHLPQPAGPASAPLDGRGRHRASQELVDRLAVVGQVGYLRGRSLGPLATGEVASTAVVAHALVGPAEIVALTHQPHTGLRCGGRRANAPYCGHLLTKIPGIDLC